MSDQQEPQFTKQEITAARKLFAGSCDFVRGVTTMDALPPDDLPEIAFVGRSNVGKSSLINALTNRKGLARSSNTPGRTRELNFFNLQGALMLVDLPGYGYARASRTDIAKWNGLMRDYLRGRAPLKRVFVLIDSRHGIKDSDREMMQMLDSSAVSYQLVLTKADKCKAPAVVKCQAAMVEEVMGHGAAHPEVPITSAEKSGGIPELRSLIAALIDKE